MAVGGNVNCISKNGTDYMYEDTAGRGFLTLEEPDLTSASKAYVTGNLFWHENTLYKVTADIASGGTITVNTNCVATTIEAELEARVKTADIHHTYTSTDRNPISGEGVADALSSFSTTLDGLDDVNIDTTTLEDGQALVRDNGEWVNGQGGHNMLDNSTIIAGINSSISEGTSNDDVVSGYGVGIWSNVDGIKILSPQLSTGTDTIGTWEDDDTWETGSRVGWIWHSALYNILGDDDYDIEPIFKLASGKQTAISCLSYRIDDNVSNGGVNGGAFAIKLNAPIPAEQNNVRVGLLIKHNRTNTFNGTAISS